MGKREERTNELAKTQGFLVGRGQALHLGWSESAIKRQVKIGAWQRRQAGVYQVDWRDPVWTERLAAAVLAGGAGCLASHRAALMLWGLDGISSAPLEITAPYTHGPVPDGVIVHRTRRQMERSTVKSIRVTTPERTLLDCCSLLPRLVMAKALESALRRGLTSVDDLYEFIRYKGGRGVRGTRMLRWLLEERKSDTPTDSGSETELLFYMRDATIPEPVLQQEFFSLEGQRMLPDFYWPRFNKAVEVDGLDAHDSADKLDHDLKRQNALMDLGVELRRFSAREVRRNPRLVVTEIERFLGL